MQQVDCELRASRKFEAEGEIIWQPAGEAWGAGAWIQASQGGGRKQSGKKVRDSGWRRQGGQGGFLNEAGQIKQERERIAHGGSFRTVG